MLGVLNKAQIDLVLRTQMVGRIGCIADGRAYVVPVTYAYDGNGVYMHSREGLKIKIMRKNPVVCFQVDAIDSMSSWRSVIAWGKFEELRSPRAQQKGMKILIDRLAPHISSSTTRPPEGNAPHEVVKGVKAIVFRIIFSERTGRFEKPDVFSAHTRH